MRYGRLANAGFSVSSVAFGCWAIAGGQNWGPQDENDSVAALRAAFDSGVTLFDSAELYGDGRSEALLARALADVRDEIVIATKASSRHYAPADLREACERSLRHLKTDRIDLYQLHWPCRTIPLSETLGLLDGLKDEGKIRSYGVSNFGAQDLSGGLGGRYRIAGNQVAYNLLFRAVEFEILPLCAKEGIPLLAYCPLMQGLLTGKFGAVQDVPVERRRTRHYSSSHPSTRHGQPGAEAETFSTIAAIRSIADRLHEPMGRVAVAWLLAQPAVGSVIVGGRNADQARENARAADLTLSPDVLAELAAVTEPLKQKLGPNADMWQSESRIR